MPISADARQYADLLFEGDKKTLSRHRDEAVAALASGLINRVDILARVGVENIAQPELDYFEAVARARARCLEAAHENHMGTFDKEIIGEILTDTGYQIEGIAIALLNSVQRDSELLAMRNGTNTSDKPRDKIGSDLLQRRAEVMK